MLYEPYLERLLRTHWLRPETALWRTFDCLLMEKYGKIEARSVDLGCGDGTLSFIMAGGRIDQFDVFEDAGPTDKYNQGADIHDSKARSVPKVDNVGLRYSYKLGFDHKEALLAKARRFGSFYQQLEVKNLNHPLPLEDSCLASAFSNILYWLDDTDACLAEWYRILDKGGRLHLFVPTARFRELTWLYNAAPHAGNRRYFNFFDRGYAGLIRHCLSGADWTKSFEKAGFAVREHHPYLSEPVMEIWNIGTRPIAPLLINMAAKLNSDDRAQIKTEWVHYFGRFFGPIIEGEFDRKLPEDQAGFHFFVLEKS